MELSFKTAIDVWSNKWARAKVGTEYPAISPPFNLMIDEEGVRQKIAILNDEELELIDKSVRNLAKVNKIGYEVFFLTRVHQIDKESIKQYCNARKVGRTKYYEQLSNAENFIRGALMQAGVIHN